MKRLKRALMVVFKVVLGIVLLVLVVGGILRVHWGRQYESRIAALKAAGQPVSLADLQGEPIPDSENAAPVYETLFALMKEPAVAKDIEDAFRVCYSRDQKITPEDWKAASAAVGRLDEVFALISEAQAKPKCRFDIYTRPASVATNQDLLAQMEHDVDATVRLFERMRQLRGVTRLLMAQALVCARDSRSQDAVDSISAALRSNDAIVDNSSLIGYLDSSTVVKITTTNTRSALSTGKFTEPQLKEMESAIAGVDPTKLYRSGLAGERAQFAQRNFEWRKAMPVLWQGDAVAHLDLISRWIDNADLSYTEAVARGLTTDDVENTIPKYAILTRILGPVLPGILITHYSTQADLAITRTTLALEAYKLRSGSYPATLAELKSKINWDIPTDPFTGKDLIYKRQGNGYTLYSLGPDQKDDGGVDLKPGEERVRKGDIVWKMER